MGGKTSQTTQQVQVPASVLQQYASVNSAADQTAQTPFQQYSTDPNAFVAPVNAQENAGIAGTNAAANEAQPYYGAATSTLEGAQAAAQPYYGAATQGTQSALAGAQPYNQAATGLTGASLNAANPLTGQQINQYLSPYLGDVLGSESALLNQNNQQQQSGQLGNAISQGAFGGDRAGIAAANLEQQQNLANANIYSGILNTGYNTALSTAQQQQGTQISADQAASQNLAAIGNQQYSQGLGAANQLAGLGQDIYNTGANTSAGLANLGTGAQAAGLQGAQAQLAAGQVQQQTQQAGDTALYNQFLQQQSYPFQVDQFLANIAEGTGSLSGSTTTTTTPGGLLGSDRRMKEDIHKVGETFDGQPIYSFKYKGDKTTRIGLMAQDVEKSHPEAVGGLGGGMKGVNYAKATEDAAKRGHFAAGGTPTLPGLSGADYAQLLQAQEQMYAPFAQQGGLYGGQAGSAVRGGASYVPQANVPVSHLAVAGPAPQRESELQQANDLSNFANKTVLPVAKWAQGQMGNGSSPAGSGAANDTSDYNQNWSDTSDNPYRTGGIVRHRAYGGLAGYADGGMPYETQGLDIPDDPNQHQLATASNPSGASSSGSSTLGQIGQLAGIGENLATAAPAIGAAASGVGSTIASILPFLALKNGGVAGRSHLADGGDPSDGSSSDWGILEPLANAIGDTFSHPLAAAKAAGLAGAGESGIDYRDDTASAPTSGPTDPLQSASSPAQYGALLKAKVLAAQSPNAVTPATTVGHSHSVSRGTPRGLTPVTDSAGWSGGPPVDIGAPSGGLVPSAPASVSPDQIQQPQALALDQTTPGLGAITPPSKPGPLDGIGQTIGGGLGKLVGGAEGLTGGYLDKIAHGDAPSIVSLLAGIGAAGAAQTKYPLIALTQGLGAGANAYMNAKKQQADIAQTQAQTGQIGAQIENTQAAAFNQRQESFRQRGLTLVPDPNGDVPIGNQRYKVVPIGSLLAGAGIGTSGSPSTYKYLGKSGQSAIDPSFNSFLGANDADKAKSTDQQSAVYAAGDNAQSNILKLNRWGQAMAANPTGFLQSGSFQDLRQEAASRWNTAVNLLVSDPTQRAKYTIGGLSDSQMATKLSTGAAAGLENELGQRSYGTLKALLLGTPNQGMQREAAINLVADQTMENQRHIDEANYMKEFSNAVGQKYPTMNRNFFASDADLAFNHDFDAGRQEAERNALQGLMENPNFGAINSALQTGSADMRASRAARLDAKVGIPGFHRIFTGNM